MKLSIRILLINFVIVVLILSAAALAFYSIMYEVLSGQQSRHLLNSANNFIYVYRGELQQLENDFNRLYSNQLLDKYSSDYFYNENNLDFIFSQQLDGKTYLKVVFADDKVVVPHGKINIKEFLNLNPHAILRKFKTEENDIYYYGKLLTPELLNSLSQKINSSLSLVWNGSPLEISHESKNLKYLQALNKAYDNLRNKGNFTIFGDEGQSEDDLLATIYRASDEYVEGDVKEFLIFSSMAEVAILKNNLSDVLLIIGSSGIVLSLILTLLFTDRLRKQLTELSKATELTSEGNFGSKIQIKSRDEVGRLGMAFNKMLDELEKNQKAKHEYSEFIKLINQNPTLTEISEAALKKIIRTCNFTVGALYTYSDKMLTLVSSQGIPKQSVFTINDSALYKPAIENHEIVKVDSKDHLPVIDAGMLSFSLKHLLILPVIYNNNVIALLELGSVDEPTAEAMDYLDKIQEQLAIGLTNALGIMQLENVIAELKKLNEDIQKQNLKIKNQNEKLVELHDQLKIKAAELEEQKKKAEESTKVKSQFLASMSHELRTPMNSILGLTELILERASLDDKNRERLNVVLKSGKRLMTLINDILDLSKIEAGKMEIREEDVMLNEILEEVESSIKPLTMEKNIDFRIIRKTNTKIMVNTDRGRVTQVLINLLGNAVKFTDKGSVTLQISDEENKNLRFDVIDTGIGISKENVKIIFEEFRQLDGTTTRKYNGTGLGLAICKKIADLLGGNISVKSKPGEGSTFSFTIPLKFVDLKTSLSTSAVNIDTLIKNRKNPILVIDDDPEIRYTIGQYLISKGYEVEYAEEGESGLQKAIKLQPFAITLDVMMPNKDGWSILKELKENPATRDIPVIMISILADKNLGYGLGAFEYFVKPISSEKLISAFNKLESLAKKRIQKIVIVDDDELEFEKFKKAFEGEDIRIEYIQDSEYAFNKIAEVQPDLIILDLMMPKVDGITLSYKLKSNPQTKHIPIILSTAKDISEEERTSLNSIVEDITVKSKGHPMDVLKVVRDRIKMRELYSAIEQTPATGSEKSGSIKDSEEIKESTESEPVKGEVLIVDDDPDTLFTVNEIVQSCNCSTILAKSGYECLEILDSRQPDLILLDIMMPGMDGFQTIKKIKANEKWKSIPVFAVTAKAMVGDKEVILKQGFDDYIAKPVNSAIMSFKINQLFSKVSSGQT